MIRAPQITRRRRAAEPRRHPITPCRTSGGSGEFIVTLSVASTKRGSLSAKTCDLIGESVLLMLVVRTHFGSGIERQLPNSVEA